MAYLIILNLRRRYCACSALISEHLTQSGLCKIKQGNGGLKILKRNDGELDMIFFNKPRKGVRAIIAFFSAVGIMVVGLTMTWLQVLHSDLSEASNAAEKAVNNIIFLTKHLMVLIQLALSLSIAVHKKSVSH